MNRVWRVVASDADAVEAAPLDGDETSVRITGALTDVGHRAVAGLLASRPDVQLWLDEGVEELEMLRHYAGLRRLGVTSLRLRSWEGVRHVAESLTELHASDTLRPISIAPLSNLRALTALGIHGPVRHIETLAALVDVRDLQLRSVTLPDLSLLRPMVRLRALFIGLGGTGDLSLLPRFDALEELELWRIRGLRDLSVLGSMPAIRVLRLQSMSGVTELPSMRQVNALRTVALETMKGITDLSPVAEAPALEELLLVDMPQLDAESLRPLVGHPTLRRGIWGFGSTRKNVAAWDLLPLGTPPFGHPRLPTWVERASDRDGSTG